MSDISDVFVGMILVFARWVLGAIVLIPLACVVLTPVVLIFAITGEGSYWQKVAGGYKAICKFLLPHSAGSSSP